MPTFPIRTSISRDYGEPRCASGTGTLSAQRIWKPSKLPTDPSRCRLVRLLERERCVNDPDER